MSQPATPAAPPRGEPPVIRVSGAAEILAYVPHTLGFHPEDSVVIIGLRPPRSRLGLTVRFDLPQREDAAACAQLLRPVAGHLRHDGASEVIAVIYTDGTPAQARQRASVRSAVAGIRDAPGMPPMREVWLVTPTGYAALDCTDADCCPPRGRSLEELGSTRVGAELALRGSSPKPSRAALVPPRSKAGAARRAFTASYQRTLAEQASDRSGAPAGPGAQVAELLALLLQPSPRPGELGRIAALAANPIRRDAVMWAVVAPEEPEPGELTALAEDPEQLRGRLLDLLVGGSPPRRAPLEQAIANAAAGCALASAKVRAELCALVAWLRWMLGDGAGAHVAATEAVRITPTQPLARLVDELLDRAEPPPWVRAKASRAVPGGLG